MASLLVNNDEIEIIKEISGNNPSRNNPFVNSSINTFIESESINYSNQHEQIPLLFNNDFCIKRIEQLESMQNYLLETIQFKSYENQLLKQNESILIASINELNEKYLNIICTLNETKCKDVEKLEESTESLTNKINQNEFKLKKIDKNNDSTKTCIIFKNRNRNKSNFILYLTLMKL
jgi:hypothetical protein